MKKISLVILTGLLAFHVQANEKAFCGYKDYFHLDTQISPLVIIIAASADPEINLHLISPRSFEIRDSHCAAGYGHVTVAYSPLNWCVLDIKDGPYMLHPVINASCNGLRYKGLSYDGLGSNSYTIKLD